MNKSSVTNWFLYFAPRYILLSLLIGIIVRIVLIFHPLTVCDWGSSLWFKIFGLGVINDIAFAILTLIPAFVIYSLMCNGKYYKPLGYTIFGILVAATAYFLFTHDISNEYGSAVPKIINITFSILTIGFAIRFFFPSIRSRFRVGVIYLTILLYALFLILVAIAEVVFWSEFGVRFNFIAVDYLVYTHEVIGNIMESYPMGWIGLAILIISVAIVWLFVKKRDFKCANLDSWKKWSITAVVFLFLLFVSSKWLHYGYTKLVNKNLFATELQENGGWDFLEAFSLSELNFNQFYATLPDDQALELQRELCNFDENGIRKIKDSLDMVKKNIVLITVESLSGEFLSRYGGKDNITPNLDTLIQKSLAFDYLYAAGNRTVRGLEALTLSIPPSSGESLIKRENDYDLYSVGDVLRENGYRTIFVYGGNSYFDNMGEFFSERGYEIYDKECYDQEKIEFSNIWGTSDEDTYRETLKILDSCWEKRENIFAHIMTISNHRPYTYPDGRIEYEGNPMSRQAAVKYTDWAIGDFIAKASKKEWFSSTVFIIIADHCASSAGKMSLPLKRYHIPAMIYSPGFIEPQFIEKVCSQIDIFPTLFSLMHVSYDSPFFGENVLSEEFKQRSFMATYQDLGYYSNDTLTVLSPVKQIRQYSITNSKDWNFKEKEVKDLNQSHIREAQGYYQTINNAYSKKR